ncbi:MAG: sugar transferase, partial [Citrobacter sp.]
MYRLFVKRALDIILSGMALILLLPVFILLTVLIKANLGSPVIFEQERPGLHAKIFRMFKFRTMLPPQTRDGKELTDAERLACIEKGIAILSDEERLTKLGRFLRASSLDELPELINIFIGD